MRSAHRFDVETLASTPTTTSRPLSIEADPARRSAFEGFARALREELAPRGVLESIYAERAILAAWRLREAVEAERAGVIEGIGADSADLFGRLDDDLRRQSDRGERALRRAIDALGSIRGLGRPDWGHAAPLDTTVPAPDDLLASDPYPALPDADFEAPAFDEADSDADMDVPPADEAPEVDDVPPPRWQDRLVLDDNVSDDSPVVKGTWVTVAQVVTLIVDGFTWADILRSHPELTEDDIRACLGFAIEQESDSRGDYLP